MVRMLTLLAACPLAMAASAGSAQPAAGGGVLGDAVGNTVTGQYDDGRVVMRMRPDGRYTVVTPGGESIDGHWLADRAFVCFVGDKVTEDPGDRLRCERNSFAGKRVGDSWRTTDFWGNAVTVSIAAGQ